MAKISDASVHEKTGRTWSEWFDLLDRAGAASMSHKEIVAHLAANTDVSSWWQQSITVRYEQERGLRDAHQTPQGFEVSASKTVDVPVSTLYAAFATDRERARWLEDDRLIVLNSRREKSLRGTWADGPTRIDVYFTPRSSEKTQVTVTHGRIESAEAAEEMKAFWRERLEGLKGVLEKK